MSGGISISQGLLATLEGAVNRYLALDPESAARLEELQGRVILVELTGFGGGVFVIPGAGRLQLYSDFEGEPDCVLRGTPLALARMVVSRRKEDQLFSGEVQIEGDTHLAQVFGDILGSLDVDWEEQLSRLVGDAAAHQIGFRVRAAQRWGKESADTLTENVKEYLQEESRLLPSHYEIQEFLSGVDRLRDDAERLAARVDRLIKLREGTSSER